MVASKNDKKFNMTLWVTSKERDIVDLYAKQHRLKSRSEALRNILKDYVIIKPEHQKMKADWEKYKDMLTQKPNGETSQPSNGEISEQPCKMMVYVEDKPICADPNAPISNFLKVHLNAQICVVCRMLKKEAQAQHKDLKSPKRQKTTTSKLDSKRAKIYCIGDGLFLEVLKCQAKCRKCQLHDFKRWADCQQNYQKEISERA